MSQYDPKLVSFTMTFTSAYLLEVIWLPFILGSWNLVYATYPDLNFKLSARVARWVLPGGKVRVQNVCQIEHLVKTVIAVWAKSKGRGRLWTLDTCLVSLFVPNPFLFWCITLLLLNFMITDYNYNYFLSECNWLKLRLLYKSNHDYFTVTYDYFPWVTLFLVG